MASLRNGISAWGTLALLTGAALGAEVELRGGSTDLGTDSRGVVVEDADGRVTELDWRDLDAIDFFPAPAGAAPEAKAASSGRTSATTGGAPRA